MEEYDKVINEEEKLKEGEHWRTKRENEKSKGRIKWRERGEKRI